MGAAVSEYVECMSTASRLLAEVSSARGAWDLARLAEAARTLAKMQSLGIEATNHATAIKAKAFRLLAELVDEGQANGEIARPGGDRTIVPAEDNGSQTYEDIGIKRQTVHAARQLRDGLTDADVDRMVERANKCGREISVKRLLRVARESTAEQRRQEPVEPITIEDGIDIRHGDFRDVLSDLPPDSVDAIITDPPYPFEFIGLFTDLGDLAARVLTRTGVLAALTGQTWLSQYMRALDDALAYRWMGAYIVQGPRNRVHGARVGTGWKPVLLYQRDDADTPAFLLDDVFDSAGDDKAHHHWGQSESGIGALVERLTTPGALVVDPFLGGGTTAVVCRDLGRRFIGCDIDAGCVARARERVA